MKSALKRWAGSSLLLPLALLLSAPVNAQQSLAVPQPSPAVARQSPAAVQQVPTTERHFPADSDLEFMLRYIVEDGETPGIVLGVLEADGSTRIVSYGSGGPDTRPLGPLSEFEIGSINKTFTATLLADMVLRGEVSLDDPVSKYLPDSVTVPSRDGRQITLEELATHTSGLPRNPGNYKPTDMGNPWADYNVATMLAFLSSYTLPRDPGASYEYSNYGYGLLGYVLGRAAGMSYRALLRQRVLEPLGMDMTRYALQGPVAQWMTRGHANGAVVPYWFGTAAVDGAGGLRSDAEDMLKYLKANVDPPKTELGRAMTMAHQVRVPVGNQGAGHGLAWNTAILAGHEVVHHSGGTGGFTASIAFDPHRRVGTVVLANTYQFKDNLGTALLFPEPPPASWKAPSPARDVLARDVGTYQATNGQAKYYVRLEPDGFLTYQPVRQARTRMYARPDGSFYLLRGPWTLTFQQDGKGNVVGMVMEVDQREPRQAGATITTRRIAEDTPPPAAVAGNGAKP